MKDHNLRNSNTVFFVDHDFDGLGQYESSNRLYVTSCYSIENLYVRDFVVKDILTSEFGIDDFENKDELDRIISLYNQMLLEFIEAVNTLNAWIAIQREKEEPNSKLNLSGKKLNSFVAIRLGKVEKKYTKDELQRLFPNAVDVSVEELDEKENEFKAKNRVDLFRGKYFIEFMRIFLELLREDRQNDNPQYFQD